MRIYWFDSGRHRHAPVAGRPKRVTRHAGIGRGRLECLEGRALLTSAAFAVTSDWGSGFGGRITLTNTQATAVSNWDLSFTWDRSITSIWDGTIASHSGNQYTISDAGYNATIPAGGSVSFGFNGASGDVGSDVPTGYRLDGVAIGTGQATTLSINNVTVDDGASGATAAFTVSLSQPSTSTVTVGYATADGTAHAGTDYTAKSGTLTFSPGTTSQTIQVPIRPDAVAKPNLTFQVNLSNADGAGLANTSGTGTIVDTVPPPTTTSASTSFQVTSDWGSGFGGQITIVNTGSAPIDNWQLGFTWDRSITSIWNATAARSGNQYLIVNAGWNATIPAGGSVSFGFNGSPGNVGADVPTNYQVNGAPLGPPLPSLNIGNVTVNDGASGAKAVFTVSLSQASTQPVTVHYATADGSAHAGTDYTSTSGTLTLSPGTTTQTIGVPILPDTTAKPDLSFQVNLSNAANAALGTASATGTIVDTIAAPPVAGDVWTTTLEGAALTLNVLADASDPSGYPLSLSTFTQPGHGAVVEDADSTLTYTPAAGYLGADSFTYTVSDGHGNASTGTVSLTVVAPMQAGTWPAHVFAPYIDMTLYPTYNLSTATQSAGLKYFTLAFITADPSHAPAWGGYASYEVNGGEFDQSIRSQVAQMRAAGGDVSVSFGGEAGQELAQAITSAGALTSAYQQVINAYGLTHIDFDIEGAAVADHASIDRRSQAIAALQASAAASGRSLSVSFTLPVLPTGLTADGLYVLQSALKYGVKVGTVNVMAMDYGDSAAPNPQGQMGAYAIDSAQGVHTELGSLYGTSLSSGQLWGMIGVTPMIGVNDASDEVFGLSDASQLTTFAEQVGLGELAMWSLTRDQEDPRGALAYAESTSSSIVQTPFEFSDIFNAFTGHATRHLLNPAQTEREAPQALPPDPEWTSVREPRTDGRHPIPPDAPRPYNRTIESIPAPEDRIVRTPNPTRIIPPATLALLLGLALAPAVARAQAGARTAPRRPPNILFIFSDDLAYQAVSAYQDSRRLIETPNIDRIAREGMRFDRCLVPNSICGPSRATILTGKYSHLNGFYNNSNSRFDGSQPTFPKMLRAAGYQTAIFGKWHLVTDPTGFDEWHILPGQGVYYNPPMIHNGRRVKHEGYTTDIITGLTLDWLKGRDRSKPFLLMCQQKAPHREWSPALRHLGHDHDRKYPEPATLFDDYSGRGKAEHDQDMTIAKTMNDVDVKLTPPRTLTPAQRKEWDAYYEPRNAAFRAAKLEGPELVRWKYNRYMHDYLGCVKAVDEGVGRLLKYLDDEGPAENTIVVFSSDQGFYLGEHGWFDKRWIFEESLRTPLLVRWPGVVKPGGVSAELVSNLDFGETFLEAAGVPIPADMQGRSLVPLLAGRTPPDWRKSFYYEYYEYPQPHHVRPHHGVVTSRYKLVRFDRPDVDTWELFDREKDPHELRSVYDDPAYASTIAELKRELGRLRTELRVPAEPPAEAFGPVRRARRP